MPDGNKHAKDEGGYQRREDTLQPREGEASLARLLDQRAISGLTRRTTNTRRMVLTEPKASEGAIAPSATLSPAVSRMTGSGSPMAIMYQYHLTRSGS